jgi:hypothetical protein
MARYPDEIVRYSPPHRCVDRAADALVSFRNTDVGAQV